MDRSMRTSAHETRIGRVTSLLLLFIRTAGDLGPACRQVGEFLAFCRSRQSGSFANERLLGAWIDEHAVTELPQEMELRLPTNEVIMLAVRETFSLCGVWTVASIEPVCLETKAGMALSHDMVFDALFALARGDTGRVGRCSPAFARDTPKKQVRAEIKRLNTRYPLRIEQSIYYDPVTGGLSLDEE
ncbi:MAG: hypothetical protein ACYCTW_09795 [Sulfuricella sp.]